MSTVQTVAKAPSHEPTENAMHATSVVLAMWTLGMAEMPRPNASM
jgi:hypothetical protein